MVERTPLLLEGQVRRIDKLPLVFPVTKIKCDRCSGVIYENKKEVIQRFDSDRIYEKYKEAVYRPCPKCKAVFCSVDGFKLRSRPVCMGFLNTKAVKARIKPLQAVIDLHNKYPRFLTGVEIEYARLPKTHCFDPHGRIIILKFKKLSARKNEQVRQVIKNTLHFLVHQWQEVEQKWSLKLHDPCKDLFYENEANDFVNLYLDEALEKYYKVEEDIGPGWP